MEATGNKRQRDAVGAWTLCCFVLHVYRVFVLDRGCHVSCHTLSLSLLERARAPRRRGPGRAALRARARVSVCVSV